MLSRLGSGVALVSVAALVLVGCTPDEPVETTTPPSPTPSDNDATLEGAREAWEAYQTRLSEIGEEPQSASLDSLLEVAEQDFARFLLENFEDAADRRVHTEGPRRTVAFEAARDADGPDDFLALVCVDVSEERLVGDEGVDLTPADREPLQSQTVEFISATEGLGYLVAGVTPFDDETGDDPCA